MKKNYVLLICMVCMLGFSLSSNAQSVTVSGSFFLSLDSIGFEWENPNFDSSDWIGVYRIEDGLPDGDPPSVVWDYIPSATGSFKFAAPQETGTYKAYLLCCDGYEVLDSTAEFQVAVPTLESASSSYTQGDTMEFTYYSPMFSSTDWIGIYPTGTTPSADNPSIDWTYIPDTTGTVIFETILDPGVYDAYLLCCDGYDSLAITTFEVIDPNVAFINPASTSFEAGSPIEINYNNPSFANEDWIGIYLEGDDPALVSSIVWTYIESSSGTVSFPGTLAGGSYYAVLFCCNSSETIYAESVPFTVEAGDSGTYVQTVASTYPENVPILVNYRTNDFQENDWIGIYNKGDDPGSTNSIDWQYITSDSGTVEFTTMLVPGNYSVILFCCDGYQIRAKYDFQIADDSTPSLISSALTFSTIDSLVFHYNSPDYVDTDWIGIYNPGDVPGDINSIFWDYLPESKGTMVFQDHGLQPGNYWAGLFCCDGYDLYAKINFIVTETSTSLQNIELVDNMLLFPNPTKGIFSIQSKNGQGLQEVQVFSLTGKLIYREKFEGNIDRKTLDLSSLANGMYSVTIRTDGLISSELLVIH